MDRKTTHHQTCVDPALDILERLYHELPQIHHWKNLLASILLDLRFFKMFVWAFEYRDEDDDEEAENDSHLHNSVIRALMTELAESFMDHEDQSIRNWELGNLVQRIKKFKPQIRESCIVFLAAGAFKCKSPNYDKFYEYVEDTVDFLLFVLDNLKILSIVVDQQIRSIVEKLKLFGDFVDVALESMLGRRKFQDFLSYTQTWATHVCCFACVCWINGVDESMRGIMGYFVSDLMQKTTILWLHLNLLKAARCLQLSIHQLDQFGARYVDFLLDNLDDVEALREGLIFLLSFVTDPPLEVSVLILNQFDPIPDASMEESWLIWTQMDAIISEVPSLVCSVHLDKRTGGTSISKSKLSNFLKKIDGVKAAIIELHVLMLPRSNFPKTNAIGFLDFLLRNLKHMLERKGNFINPPFKFRVEIVQEELELLRPFLHHVMKLQNEHEEIKDLWMQIVGVAYNANYAIKLSSLMDVPLWFTSFCLSCVIEDIKLIKTEVKKVMDDQIYNNIKLVAEVKPSDALPQQARTSVLEGVFIGFVDDARSVIDHLVGGRKDLKIISILGMPGQGKTTLARRIYNDPEVQYHFHITAWCYVSKECKTRDLLIGILRDLGNKVDVGENLNLEIQDLVEHLWRSLKGRRYMIVLDDIWDVEVWQELQRSFPDDNNGSRILFTSRNQKLASQAKPNSISHPVRLFSEEESMDLMKEKIPQFDGLLPELSEIAKKIAVYCKGLPLAISLIASLLGRTRQQMDLWNQIAENLKSHIVNEGCAHVIELSYKYLAEYLKPCFLYFGAFPRGKYIRARKLKLLWIAEGFVQENDEVQRSEDLANEYLEDLVSQGLVLVRQRSSNGGVKTCAIHDLLYDLCLQKTEEENFLQFTEEFIHPHSCRKYEHYRLCIRETNTIPNLRSFCTQRKLLFSQVHTLRCYDHYFGFAFNVPDLASFKVLTVLDLEYVLLNDYFYIPEALLSFVHLRYLAIYAAIEEIPPSICGLWNLETLIIKGAKMDVKFPETILSMKSLRHVKIDGSFIVFPNSEPQEASKVCNIERLSSPILCYTIKSEKFLRRLQKLRKLRCYFVEQLDPRHPDWLSIFKPLTKMESLRIDYPHMWKAWLTDRNSQKFAGFEFPDNLKKLTLSGLRLPWSAMSKFMKMHNLEVLKLEKEACSGLKWDLGHQEFPKLRYLKLCELDIEEIDVSCCDDDDNNPFPCLEQLVVDNCERLEDIPSSFGDICTLKAITVSGWSSLKGKCSAMRVLKEQQDMGNDGIRVSVIHGGGDDDDGTSPLEVMEKRFQKHMGFANAILSATGRLRDVDSAMRILKEL